METFVTLIGVTDIERCLELKLFNSIKRGGGGRRLSIHVHYHQEWDTNDCTVHVKIAIILCGACDII